MTASNACPMLSPHLILLHPTQSRHIFVASFSIHRGALPRPSAPQERSKTSLWHYKKLTILHVQTYTSTCCVHDKSQDGQNSSFNQVTTCWCTRSNKHNYSIINSACPITFHKYIHEKLIVKKVGFSDSSMWKTGLPCRRFGPSTLTFFRAKMKLEWNTCHYIALHPIKCCHWICQLAPQVFGWIRFRVVHWSCDTLVCMYVYTFCVQFQNVGHFSLLSH